MSVNVLVSPSPFNKSSSCRSFSSESTLSDVLSYFTSSILPDSYQTSDLSQQFWWSFASGKLLPSPSTPLQSILSNYTRDVSLRLNFRLLGGKGGFGSMLRAQGGRMSKKSNKAGNSNTEKDNYRTIDGRRYKSIRQAKELSAYLDMKNIKAKEKLKQKKEKYRNIIAKAPSSSSSSGNSNPTLYDPDYLEETATLTSNIKNSIQQSLQSKESSSSASSDSDSSSLKSNQVHKSAKSKKTESEPKKRAPSKAFFDEELSDSSDDDSE